MKNQGPLLRNANFIAASVALFFTLLAFLRLEHNEFLFLLIITSIYFINTWLSVLGFIETSKWVFVLNSNLTILLFDGGFNGYNHPYVFLIPIVISYFILNRLPQEWIKTLVFIGISALAVYTVNFTDITPRYAERMGDKKMADFLAAMLASVALVVILLHHYHLKNKELEKAVNKGILFRAQLQGIIDSGLQHICLLDHEGRIVLSDKNTIDTFKRNQDKKLIPGMHMTEFLPDMLHWEFTKNFKRALAGETLRVQRKVDMGPSGESWFDVVYRPVEVRTEQDGLSGYVIFAWHDVTELMQAKVMLEKSENLIKSINQNIREGIYRSTIEEGWIYVNQAFVELFGYEDSRELFGQDPGIMYVHLEDRHTLIRNVREKGYFNSKEVEMRRKDGSIFWASVSCSLSRDEKGKEIFDVAVRDITEYKMAEMEVRRQKEMAEAASKAKADFLSVMSHEIRTPMNAILGFTNLLLEADYLKKEDMENLLAIEHSAENLLSIINDILDFSKIEAGKITLSKEKFNIRELLKELNQTTAFIACNKDLKMRFSVDIRIPDHLIGDAVRLNQVLLNLCSNAIKFTAEGGIDVDTTLKSMHGDQVNLEFTVRDTGIGIPVDKIDKIFESFTQADPHISRRFGGTGLGLTISKRLVELMGGTISVQSIEGRGSEFTVTLPLFIGDMESSSQKAASGNRMHDLSGYHFLLVEDNRMNIMLATQLLKRWKASFDVAENGLEATDMLSRNRYDIVLLDLQLPYKSGFDVFNDMRSPQSTAISRNIPVIALTADAFEETREKVFKTGINDLATKPFDAETLYDKITYWLHRRNFPVF